MDVAGRTENTLQPSEHSDALERFLSSDEGGGSGYGVATYVSARLATCRIYNLENNELCGTLELPGEYATLSCSELKHALDVILDRLALEADVPLSKVNVAVVSGTTAMESKASNLEESDLLCDLEAELVEFGRDVEFIMAGTNAIAVGQAYFVPCLNTNVGGDVFCNLLAIDILGAEKPQLFINTGSHDTSGIVLVYGNRDKLSVCAVPDGVSAKEAMRRLLEVCQAEYEHVERTLVSGDIEVEVPSELRDRTHRVPDAAIEGASAILLSEMAEDELCRIVSSCHIVEV